MASYAPEVTLTVQSGDIDGEFSPIPAGHRLDIGQAGFGNFVRFTYAAQPDSIPETGAQWFECETPDLPADIAWVSTVIDAKVGESLIQSAGNPDIPYLTHYFEIAYMWLWTPDDAIYPVAFTKTGGGRSTQPKATRAVSGETFGEIIERHGSARLRIRVHSHFVQDNDNVLNSSDLAELETVEVIGETFPAIAAPAVVLDGASDSWAPHVKVPIDTDDFPDYPRAVYQTITDITEGAVVEQSLIAFNGGHFERKLPRTLAPGHTYLHLVEVIYDRFGDIERRVAVIDEALVVSEAPPGPPLTVSVDLDEESNRHTVASIDYAAGAARIERKAGSTDWVTIVRGGADEPPAHGYDYPPLNVPVTYRSWHGIPGTDTATEVVEQIVEPIVVDSWMLSDAITGDTLRVPTSAVTESRQSTTVQAVGNNRASHISPGIITSPLFSVSAMLGNESAYHRFMTIMSSQRVVLRGPHGQTHRVTPVGQIVTAAIRNAKSDGANPTSMMNQVTVQLATDDRWL